MGGREGERETRPVGKREPSRVDAKKKEPTVVVCIGRGKSGCQNFRTPNDERSKLSRTKAIIIASLHKEGFFLVFKS